MEVTGTADSLERASTLVAQAEAAALVRDHQTARAHYQEALSLLDGDGPIVRALAGFGWTLYWLGDYGSALARHEEALTHAERLFPGDEAKLAVVQDGIAQALLRLGRATDALALLRTILARGISGRSLAVALNWASEAASQAGLPEEAFRYQMEAVQTVRASLATGPEVDEDIEVTTQSVARLLRHQEKGDEADALLRQLYARQSFRLVRSRQRAEGTLLVVTSLDGNIPDTHLLPRLNMNVVKWMIELSDDEHERRLPAWDVILNLAGDADHGTAALARLSDFAARKGVTPINRPEHVLRTRRDRIVDRLAGIDDLVVPRVARIEMSERGGAPSDVLRARGLRTPVLLREAGRHGGESVVRAQTEEALAQAWRAGAGEAYLTEYYDYVAPDGYWRKYRVIFVDRRPYPYHLAISPNWLVHYFSADMIDHPWKHEEESRFLADMPSVLGERAMVALEQVGRRLDLDYCGIDFSLLADGRMVLFEANATMLVHPEDKNGPLASKNIHVGRILDAFDELVLCRLHKRSNGCGDRI